MIIAVEIWPAAEGCRAIDSTAEPPMRPMPAPPPMIARPAPMAPPSHAAPLLVISAPDSPAPCASATAGDNITAAPAMVNPAASLPQRVRSIIVSLSLNSSKHLSFVVRFDYCCAFVVRRRTLERKPKRRERRTAALPP
jgi:hypothetical protein